MKVNTLVTITLATLSLGFVQCNKAPEGKGVSAQREKIEKYLNSKSVNYRVNGDLFSERTNVLPSTGNFLERGDSAYIVFDQYIFGTSLGKIFYTNNPVTITKDGFTGEYLKKTPMGIKWGETELLKGWDLGLEGTRGGDSIMLYMTSDLAFGEKPMGIVEKWSSIAIFVDIKRVIKQQ